MFRFGSKKINRTEYRCTIRFLDDDEPPLECNFQHLCKGQFVLDFVCKSIGLLEKDYFGLRYVDQDNQRRWLDLSKPVLKQTKKLTHIVFCFRVKFYPPYPLELKEESTRYQIYLQLKRDLSHGRLNCTQSEAALCVAYIKQAEFGDYREPPPHESISGGGGENGEDKPPRPQELRILPKHSTEIDDKIERIHATLKGVSATDAQDLFLKQASCLESYGIDPHPVKDDKNQQIYIGINHQGILTFLSGKKHLNIRFEDLVKFNYEGKMFILHVRLTGSSRKQVIGFKCPTQAACLHLYNCANDIRCFFTSIALSINNRNTLSRSMSITRKRESAVNANSDLTMINNNNRDEYEDEPLDEENNLVTANNQRNASKSMQTQPGRTIIEDATPPNSNQHETSQRSHNKHTNDLNSLNQHYLKNGTEKCGTVDIDSLLVHSDDEDDQDRLSAPLVTPMLDTTPTRNVDNSQAETPDDCNYYNRDTNLNTDGSSADCTLNGLLPRNSLRHLQTFVLTWLVMLFMITVATIFILESDSALFDEIKSWPPFVILRREYYHPTKSFLSRKLVRLQRHS